MGASVACDPDPCHGGGKSVFRRVCLPCSNAGMDTSAQAAGSTRVALGGCALLLASGWSGAWWDEYSRAGWSTWISMCQTSSPDFFNVLRLYAVLLPTSLIAMLLAGLVVLGLAALARTRQSLALSGIAGHAGCVVAMPLSIWLCAKLFDDPATAGLQLTSMLLLDLGIAFTLTLGLMRVLQPAVADCCRDSVGYG